MFVYGASSCFGGLLGANFSDWEGYIPHNHLLEPPLGPLSEDDLQLLIGFHEVLHRPIKARLHGPSYGRTSSA